MNMNRQMMKGNEAIAEAAVQAGCRYYFGYPITPQSEIPEYMSKRLPEVGGTFIQAESEIAAINMVYGAAGAGARAMTSSSSPGVSLKQEGISYIAGAELPCLIVNIVRGGPGLGSIQPAQSDYYQATRGGGHGDYRMPVFAPAIRAGGRGTDHEGLRRGRQVPHAHHAPGRRRHRPDDGAGHHAGIQARGSGQELGRHRLA